MCMIAESHALGILQSYDHDHGGRVAVQRQRWLAMKTPPLYEVSKDDLINPYCPVARTVRQDRRYYSIMRLNLCHM